MVSFCWSWSDTLARTTFWKPFYKLGCFCNWKWHLKSRNNELKTLQPHISIIISCVTIKAPYFTFIKSCDPLLMFNPAALTECGRLDILMQCFKWGAGFQTDPEPKKMHSSTILKQSLHEWILYLLHTPRPQWHIFEPWSPAFRSFFIALTMTAIFKAQFLFVCVFKPWTVDIPPVMLFWQYETFN